jgi:hypothetical protein
MVRILLALTLLSHVTLYGQDLRPSGVFMADSIKIGQPIKFSLSVYHLSNTQVLFPDSGYSFRPFELIKKEFYPTVTKNKLSFDSAVYIVRTFQLDTAQHLSLPVFHIEAGDSTAYYTRNDTIAILQYLPETPLSLDLKQQTALTPIEQKINYPHIIAYIGCILLLGLILYFLFGKVFSRRYKLFKVRSDHMSFVKNYQRLQKEFTERKGPMTIEQALSIWKAYLARLENKPINTYTSTEIINLYNKEELKNGLNIIDRAIYGGVISDEAEKALATLKRFSNRLYLQRKKEIQDI